MSSLCLSVLVCVVKAFASCRVWVAVLVSPLPWRMLVADCMVCCIALFWFSCLVWVIVVVRGWLRSLWVVVVRSVFSLIPRAVFSALVADIWVDGSVAAVSVCCMSFVIVFCLFCVVVGFMVVVKGRFRVCSSICCVACSIVVVTALLTFESCALLVRICRVVWRIRAPV